MSASGEPGGSAPLISEDYDPERDYPVTRRIVRLVAIASDRGPMELAPLGHTIDTDALDELIESQLVGDRDASIVVSLNYADYRVEFDADGTVEIYERE